LAAWLGYFRPELFPGDLDVPRLVYLLMALLLVTGAGYGYSRFRLDGGAALASILFWAALIMAITFAYAWIN
jgi:hypothetical protein